MRHLQRTTHAALACILAGAGIATAAPSAAEPASEAGALYARAQAEETRFDLGAARADYEACVRAAPSGRWASACRGRANDLAAHSEGGFAPLVALERARHGPQDARAIDLLAAECAGFPDGPVRAEARMLAAEAYMDRLGREDDGVRLLDRIVADPSADPLLRRFAARREADAHLGHNRLDSARDVAGRAGDPELVLHVAQAVRRTYVHFTSIALLGLVFGGAARAAIRSWRRRSLGPGRGASRGPSTGPSLRAAGPHAAAILAFAVLAGAGGAALSCAFERGHAAPFLWLGAATATLGLVARAWGALGSPSRGPRLARAALCALGVLGAAFLILEHAGVTYLKGFGL